jgi:tubulin-folding cofactor B
MAALTIFVTHSMTDKFLLELKLQPDMTVADLKKRLVSHCGTEPQHQHLSLLDGANVFVAALEDDAMTMRATGVCDRWTIHVLDSDPSAISASLSDVSTVQKVELCEEAAEARKAEFAAFKATKAKPAVDDEHLADVAATIAVGNACSANGKRAMVAYVGKIPEIAPGWWVGVEYAEAVGKNDGSIMGTRYFACADNMGGFVRPDKIMGESEAVDKIVPPPRRAPPTATWAASSENDAMNL